MASIASAVILQRAIFKNANITVLADDLNTSYVNAIQLPQLGAAKSVLQFPQTAVADFGNYNFVILPEQRRAYAGDASGDLSVSSPAPLMMKQFLESCTSVKIMAVGFNFSFEAVLATPLAEFLKPTYFKDESLNRFGASFLSLGFKLTTPRSNYLQQIMVDPVWEKQNVAELGFNFHYDKPGPDFSSRLVDTYGNFVGELPRLVETVFTR